MTSLVLTEYSISDKNLLGTDLFQLKFPLHNKNIHLLTLMVSSGNRYTFHIENEFFITEYHVSVNFEISIFSSQQVTCLTS